LKILNELEETEKLNALYKGRLEAANEELAAARQALEAGRGEVETLNGKIADLLKIKSELEAAIAGQEKRIETLRTELEEVRERADNYRRQRNTGIIIGGLVGALVGGAIAVGILRR
jgi:chromosome segregation ATPase